MTCADQLCFDDFEEDLDGEFVVAIAFAKQLAQEVANLRDIELVVVSPLSRTILTTVAAFADHPAPRLIQHLHRESKQSYCDIGRPPGVFANEFADFDFLHLDDPW